MKWLEDLLGITALHAEIEALEMQVASMKQINANLWAAKNEALGKYNLLSTDYAKKTEQLTKVIEALDKCEKLTASDKITIALLQESNLLLSTQLEALPADDLFNKECPAMLEPVDGAKVMLGQFKVKTAKWETICTYPSHAAIFMPGPIFEDELTRADCNRRRKDLSSVEICKALANVAQVNSTYLNDNSMWGIMDNWTPPIIVRMLKQDDCESLAVRIISLIHYYELKFGAFRDYQAFLGLGYFTSGNNQYGHGFVVLLKNDSVNLADHYIIEATDSFASAPMKLSDVKDRYDCSWNLIGFVTPSHPEGSYQVKTGERWWGWADMATGENTSKNTFLERIKKVVGLDPKATEAKEKKKALEEFATQRRREKDGN